MDIVLQTGNSGSIRQLDFHKSKKLLLSSDDQRVVIWDIQQRKQFSSLDFNNTITNSGFISESKIYVSYNNYVEIWDFYNRQLVYTHKTEGVIKTVKATKDELYILSDNVQKLNITTTIVEELNIINQVINDIDITSNGILMGVITDDNYFIYNLKNSAIDYSINIKNILTSFISESSKTISIAVSPSSIHTYSFSNNKIEKLNVISNDRSWNNYPSIYITENFGISGDSKDVITTYNTKKGTIISFKKNNTKSISKITTNTDHSIIAIGGENGIINLYDNAFKLFHTLKPISPVPTCIELLKDSTNIIIGYDNGDIKKWNINTHQVEIISSNNIKNDVKKRNLKIVSIADGSGILKVSWKSNLTNKIKNQFYTLTFDDLYTTYTAKKIDDYIEVPVKFNLKTKNNTPIKLQNGETISAVSNTTLNNNFLVGSSSGFIYVINNNGDQVLKMVSPTDQTFFYTTPENYYYASKSALQHVGARYKSQLIGFEQIDLVYNRPDKIIPVISSIYSDEYINLLSQAYTKRLKKLNITSTDFKDLINLPILETNLNQIPVNTKQKEIQINVSAHVIGANLKALHILINDSPIYGKHGLALSGKADYSEDLTLVLSQGKNRIQIFVENEYGTKSLRQKASVNSDYPTQPTIHLLSIGSGDFIDSNYNLKYASKDANDMRTLFQKSKQFKEIKTNSITGKDVTVNSINEAITNLEMANINDVVIIFFAGHGILDQNLDYYLSTYNINFNNPSENGLNFDDFENRLSKLKCRHKLLLIDACHSGELDKDEIEEVNGIQEPEEELLVFRSGQKSVELIGGKSAFELSKNIFIDLRSNSGVITISSAGAAEYALEGEKWKNGAFTYCLLKGIIDSDADFNNDKKISTNELQKYLFIEVPKLTNGKQTPTSRVELMEQNFIVW